MYPVLRIARQHESLVGRLAALAQEIDDVLCDEDLALLVVLRAPQVAVRVGAANVDPAATRGPQAT